MKKVGIEKESLLVCFKAALITALIIGLIAFIYLGCVKAYTEIRKVCFNDNLAAVIISENYFKFFDFWIYF